MPLEYYDRGLTADKLLPASNYQQDQYWLLRSALTSAIALELPQLRLISPRIARAAADLETFVEFNRTRSFKMLRPEDADLTHDASSGLFLR